LTLSHQQCIALTLNHQQCIVLTLNHQQWFNVKAMYC
jgi:hypothetical protein